MEREFNYAENRLKVEGCQTRDKSMKRKERPRFAEGKITFDGFLSFCYFWVKPKVKSKKRFGRTQSLK